MSGLRATGGVVLGHPAHSQQPTRRRVCRRSEAAQACQTPCATSLYIQINDQRWVAEPSWASWRMEPAYMGKAAQRVTLPCAVFLYSALPHPQRAFLAEWCGLLCRISERHALGC
jgi:hypothetical protein